MEQAVSTMNAKMDIDITTIVLSILALSTFIIPILYSEVFRKRAAKQFEKQFIELGEQKGLNLTRYDAWRKSYAIGLDEGKSKLFYLRKNGSSDETLALDLGKTTRAKVSRAEKNIKTASGKTTYVSRVDLVISENGNSQKLEFFRGDDGKTLMDEISLAEKWSRTINNRN